MFDRGVGREAARLARRRAARRLRPRRIYGAENVVRLDVVLVELQRLLRGGDRSAARFCRQ